ncbi:MAG: hypothetical protein KME60_16500 [Cyanomargarita calcarea GSE-NOS-MK-12-04C]|uniref:Uncharacterized protein n=1 Tax=Cyanomargarita calcarea GSE-NOS-MK-12-04C TaxID=2839659 RepID=A0A951QNE3_9CYAN|nr:hypothetical protein [Cyanomargarita calcarea GSE-NOS-MK-12-04C]
MSIEHLDFRQKKAALKERSTKYARMLSNFAYSKFTQLIETRCCRQGVELNRVDAAYTSVIGVTSLPSLSYPTRRRIPDGTLATRAPTAF